VTVAVVICCYTQARLFDTVAAIESSRAQEPAPRVIVVVDHNPDLLDLLAGRYPDLTVTSNRFTRGLSGARNTGIAESIEDVVAFLDDDAVAQAGWLAAICAEFEDETVIAVGGHIGPAWDGERPPWFPAEFDWVVGCSYVGMPSSRAIVRNVIGANMAFRRATLMAVGGFGAELGRVGANAAGCEETELCIRVTRRTGGTVIYQPAARVRHRVTSDRARPAYFVRRCVAEGRSKAIVMRMHPGGAGLGVEGSYAVHTLGLGVVRGLREAVRHRRGAPLLRSAAMILGLVCTGAGFVAEGVRGAIRGLVGHAPRPPRSQALSAPISSIGRYRGQSPGQSAQSVPRR
jgi:GT2 family glycosyltransferase